MFAMYRLLTTKTGGAIYIPSFLEEEQATELFQIIPRIVQFETKYMQFSDSLIPLPRKIGYVGEKDYSYSGITHKAQLYHPILKSIQDLIIKDTRLHTVINFKTLEKLNSCLINAYESENNKVHWHSDSEKELGPDNKKNILIVSLSLGEERDFVIRNKEILQKQLGAENTDNFELKVGLKHGSLLVMYGDFQHKYEHSIPKVKTRKELRINLTFRVIQ